MFDYRILGSLEVCDGDRVVALGGARCRAVLAVLVVSANRPVSVGRLIDEVWGDPAPPSAGNVVQGHVSDLRRALGREAIETRGDAYVLRVDRAGRDVDRFEQLASSGVELLRDGRPREASASFAEALALWRGPALADIAEGGLLVSEALRLDEMRLHAVERRIEAELECGHHAEVVGELRALVAEHPLREPLRAHLAVALYRVGAARRGARSPARGAALAGRRAGPRSRARVCRSSSARSCSTTRRWRRPPARSAVRLRSQACSARSCSLNSARAVWTR